VGLVKTDEVDIVSLSKGHLGEVGAACRGLADESGVIRNEGVVVHWMEVHDLARDDERGSEGDPHVAHDNGHGIGVDHNKALLGVNNDSGSHKLEGVKEEYYSLAVGGGGERNKEYLCAVDSVD